MTEPAPLKLRARDPDDLRVIAACLQDALVPLGEVAYLKADRRFVIVANRFRWEEAGEDAPVPAPAEPGDARFADDEGSPPAYQRVNCGVCFDRVNAVRLRGIDLRDRRQILNLLTIQVEPQAVTLAFSGEATIRLEVSAVSCHMEDLGEPWPTRWRPHHAPEEGRQDAET